MRTAHIFINQRALEHNLDVIMQRAPNAKVLAMVKSNAYGHGVEWVIEGLKKADAFGVATFSEALQLYQLYQQQPHLTKPVVLIEGVFSQEEHKKAVAYDFAMVIHHLDQVEWAEQYLPKSGSFSQTIWLKYNTGMNRLGFDTKTLPSVAKRLIKKGYRLILTSHFACADDKDHLMNASQIDAFEAMLSLLKTTIDDSIQGSLCNSAGILQFPDHHHDWVRPGIALYGASPFADMPAPTLNLKPVMTFCAKIMAIHHLDAGESVGYAALWTASQAAKIAIVSVGYGDGYPRSVKHACVIVKHHQNNYSAPIIGRVAMDMLMIDISLLPEAVGVGCDVILWGEDLLVDQVANHANTIGYELLCQTTSRPQRFFVNQ